MEMMTQSQFCEEQHLNTSNSNSSSERVDATREASHLPRAKRRLSLSKLLAPARPLVRNFSLKTKAEKRSAPYRLPRTAIPKRRHSEYWHETVQDFEHQKFDKQQVPILLPTIPLMRFSPVH